MTISDECVPGLVKVFGSGQTIIHVEWLTATLLYGIQKHFSPHPMSSSTTGAQTTSLLIGLFLV